METLTLGKPLTTAEPVVALDATLPPGIYRVELVVQGGNTGKSAVATLLIEVVKG